MDDPMPVSYTHLDVYKRQVKQLSCLLHNTDHRFSIENRGIDGFTLERLLQNTDFWLESSDPDIVTVLIGINDVGIMMNTRRSSAQQQDLMNKFVTRYELLAKKLSCTNSRKRKLYFLEPFVFPWPRCYASWAPLLSQMSVHIKKISQDHGAVFLPVSYTHLDVYKRQVLGNPSASVLFFLSEHSVLPVFLQ